MMFSQVFVFSLLLFAASSVTVGVKDASNVVDNLLTKVNGFLKDHNMNKLTLPDVEDDRYWIKKIFTHGILMDFATISRIGNATIIQQLTGSDNDHWVIQTTVGLSYLVAHYDFHFSTLFGLITYSGHLSVVGDTNVVDLEATVVTNTKQDSCDLVVNDAALLKLGGFKVKISRSGWLRGILEYAIEYVLNYVVPKMSEGINIDIHEFIRKYPINPEITKSICEYFLPADH
uniref:Uncharacterized protein n=1 Tax=Riptortus pedestris TaxID=329032 RepID=R4WRP4_RIPPE|nr:unknown secreted protein [Riptortus pedestris]